MARRRDGADDRVAQRHDLAVARRVVLEVDPGAFGQVCGRAGARDELGQPGDMIGLDVGVEDARDRCALRLGSRDVVLDEVDVRVDDRERAVRLAPEQVRGAGALVG